MTAPAPLPLGGVRVLAASQLGAGPWALTLLSDLGADVIKVEPPGRGDEARNVPPYAGGGDSLYFQSLNRGARGLTLDLHAPAGRAVLERLVTRCDAVYNNLRGGEPQRLGLTYDALRAANPRVVCCSLSGFGQSGPRAHEPGYDYVIQAYAGFMSLTGAPDGPPERCGVSVVDFSSGILSALALMIGLHQSQRTGTGCDVDVSLYDTALSMLNYLAGWTLNRDWHPQRTADGAHQTLVPAQTFCTADGFLVVMCLKEKFWHALCERIERIDLREDARFATFADRHANRHLLLPLLTAELRRRTTADWLERLRGHVPCGPVYSVEEALADEHALARDMVIELEHPAFGLLRQVGTPIKMSGARPVHRRAPRLGEHTDEILAELGGYGAAEIARLHDDGVV